jgi:hypothetical protein
VIAERGVRYGRLVQIPMNGDAQGSKRAGADKRHRSKTHGHGH